MLESCVSISKVRVDCFKIVLPLLEILFMEEEEMYTPHCFQRQLWMGRTCFQSGAPGRCLIYPPIHFSAEASRILAVLVCLAILQVILLQVIVSFLRLQSSFDDYTFVAILSCALAVCSSDFLRYEAFRDCSEIVLLKVSFFNMLMWM